MTEDARKRRGARGTARTGVGGLTLGLALILCTRGWADETPTQKSTDPAQSADKKPEDKKPEDKKPAAGTDGAGVKVEKAQGGARLFRITEGMLVEGQRQKPNAFYVLQRASAPYDWEALDESFLPRIVQAVKKPPFEERR